MDEEKSLKRSIRRHHRRRIINHHKRWLAITNDDAKFIDEYSVKLAKTRKPCSCYMCGNPRKHFKKKTRQEIIIETEGSDDEA